MLAAWIASVSGRPVQRLSRVGSGSSRATYEVTLGDASDTDEAIARVDTGDGPMAGTELSLAREATVYRALAGSGVRIPRLRAAAKDGTVLLVDRAPGRHELDGLTPEARDRVLDDAIDALAEVHRLDVDALDLPGWRRPADGPAHAREELAVWGDILERRTSRPWPLAELARVVLDRLAPPTVARTVLCHGDVGPGNFLHDGTRVTALLDWEFAHLGDPMDDLAWWVFRGHDIAGGCGDLAAQLARWSAATGLAVDPAAVEYYRAFVMFRWLVSVAAVIDGGGAGLDRSVHFALVPVLAVRLTRSLATLLGVGLPSVPPAPTPRPTATAKVIDALAADLLGVIGPAVGTPEAGRRVGASQLYLSHLAAADALGPEVRVAALDDVARLTGTRPDDEGHGARLVAELVRCPEPPLEELIAWSWREAHRLVALWPLVAPRALTEPTPVRSLAGSEA